MTVDTLNRHLLVQLQIGQTTAGKPKLHNRVYPHVDPAAADTAVTSVLQALEPLFADVVYALGRVDTVALVVPAAASGPSSTAVGKTGTTSSGGPATPGGTAVV